MAAVCGACPSRSIDEATHAIDAYQANTRGEGLAMEVGQWLVACYAKPSNEPILGKELFMRFLYAACISICLSVPALAQTATPESMSLAKQLIAKIEPNPQQTISQLGAPMVGMMQQMGIKDPERAQVIVREALMPMLSEHIGGLTDRAAAAYAETLSVEDLRAIIAFYDTKAGQDLIKAQPMLAQRRVQGMTAWMGEMQPEMQTKIAAVMKQHGWDKAN